jgi:hypothetical protein
MERTRSGLLITGQQASALGYAGTLQIGGLIGQPIQLNTSTPTLIFAKRFTAPFRLAVMMMNMDSANDIYWSESPNVIAAPAGNQYQGWLLKSGQAVPVFFSDIFHQGDVWAIANTGSPFIQIGEFIG